MTSTEAIELKQLLRTRDDVIAAYRRKKSWRQSEIAMSIADVENQKKALQIAIGVLSKLPGDTLLADSVS